MTSSALRPRTVTEIVDAAFNILKAHYSQFVMCSAIAYLPWLIVELVVVGDPQERLGSTLELSASSVYLGGAAMFGVWITFALMSAVIVSCASQAYLGEPVDVGTAVRRALPRLPHVMIAAVGRYLLLIVGFLFFLVGALYVAARYFALTPAIVLEDANAFRAFGRSAELSLGRKRHILNTLGLVAIIYWVVGVGVSLLAAIGGNFVVSAVASAFYTILAYPVVAITECLLYYDARIQSEGLDIQLLAAELEAPAAPAS